jgi:isoamylase
MGRSQQGNNNAYCQDNDVSWVDWDDRDESLFEFLRELIQLRSEHPSFRRRRFFDGEAIAWFTPAAEEMTGEDWEVGHAKALTVCLNGDEITEPDRRGQPIRDSSFLLLFNASELDLDFMIVPTEFGEGWEKVLDTAEPATAGGHVKPGDQLTVMNRSMQLFRRKARERG